MRSLATTTFGEQFAMQNLTNLALLALFFGAASARADTIYVSLDSNNTIATFDTTASNPTPKTFVSTGPNSNPTGLAFDSSGNLYSANDLTNSQQHDREVHARDWNRSSRARLEASRARGPRDRLVQQRLCWKRRRQQDLRIHTKRRRVCLRHGGGSSSFGLAFNSSGNLFVATGRRSFLDLGVHARRSR